MANQTLFMVGTASHSFRSCDVEASKNPVYYASNVNYGSLTGQKRATFKFEEKPCQASSISVDLNRNCSIKMRMGM